MNPLIGVTKAGWGSQSTPSYTSTTSSQTTTSNPLVGITQSGWGGQEVVKQYSPTKTKSLTEITNSKASNDSQSEKEVEVDTTVKDGNKTGKKMSGLLSRLLDVGKNGGITLFGGLDQNGNPISASEVEKERQKSIQKVAEDKTQNVKYADTFGGQFNANFVASRLGQEQALANSRVASNPTQENMDIANKWGELATNFSTKNAEALDDTNAKATLLTKDVASYLPQLWNQAKYSGLPSTVGAVVGGLTSGSLAGAGKGIKAGAVLGSGAYSFDVMKGASYNTLTQLGADHDIANKASTDEALISTAIEMGDTAIDLFVGLGKNILGNTSKEVVLSLGKQIAVDLAKYGINIEQEGQEESVQEIISIANEMRIANGGGNGGIEELYPYIKQVVSMYAKGEGTDVSGESVKDRVNTSRRGGKRLAAVMGGTQALMQTPTYANRYLNAELNDNASWNAALGTEAMTDINEANKVESVIPSADTKVDSYNKLANEILSDEQKAMNYRREFGQIQGNSKTEQAKNIASNIANATRPTSTESQVIEAETPTVETQTNIPSNPKTDGQIGAIMHIRDMQRNGATFADARQIVEDPIARQVFEQISGITLSDKSGKAREQVVNYINSNRITEETTMPELATDENGNLITDENGHYIPKDQTQYNGKHENNNPRTRKWGAHETPFYPKTHNKPNPEVSDNGKKITPEPYQGAHAVAEVEEETQEPTNYKLKNNPKNKAQNRLLSATQGNIRQENKNAEKVANNELNSAPKVKTNNSTITSEEVTTKTIVPPVNENATAREVETQSNALKGQNKVAGVDYEAPNHVTVTEIESLTDALARVKKDSVGEMQSLSKKDAWTGKDIDTAMAINGQLLLDAIENNDFTAADAWQKIVQAHTSEAGRALQALNKWAKGGEVVLQKNVEKIKNSNLDETQKTELSKKIAEFATEYDKIENGDIDSLKALIKNLNDFRQTGTLIKKLYDKLLNEQTDFDYLKEYALRQLSNASEDFTNPYTIGEKLKSWQTIAQLFRITTTLRNIGGNESFGAIDLIPQDSLGVAIDYMLSKIDGSNIRAIPMESSWLNSEARQAMMDATKKSIFEVAGDINMGSNTAYGTSSQRTFKMSKGNIAEKVLSRTQQILGYTLSTTDVASWSRQATSYASKLMEINEGRMSQEEADALAKTIADYRTFKNDGIAKKMSTSIHDALNFIGIGGKVDKTGRKGGFGLAEVGGLSYPGVPANLGVKPLEYSPFNAVKGFAEMCKYVYDAKKKGTVDLAARQRAAMDFARGTVGTALIAGFAQAFASGVVKYYDDEDDYDVVTQQKAEGKTGTLINLDAILREDKEWRPEDTVINIAWMQPANTMFAISYYIYKDKEEDGKVDHLLEDFVKGIGNGFLDMPVVSSIADLVDVFKSNYDSEFDTSKAIEAGVTVAGNAIKGMQPGMVSQAAKAIDKYDRDTRADTTLGRVVNEAKKNSLLFRQTLPIKTDSFGNEMDNFGGAYNKTMNALVRPGEIKKIEQSEVSKEVERLYNETGVSTYPRRKAPNTISFTDDNKEKQSVTLTTDQKLKYEETAGKKCEELYDSAMKSSLWDKLSDEDKTAVFKTLRTYSEGFAKNELYDSQNIDYTSDLEKFANKGLKDSGKLADYVIFKQQYNNCLGDSSTKTDYAKIDKLVEDYKTLPILVKEAANENDYIEKLNEASRSNIDSETWFKYYNLKKDIVSKGLGSATEQQVKVNTAIDNDKLLTTAQKDVLKDQMLVYYSSAANDSTYEKLVDAGFTPDFSATVSKARTDLDSNSYANISSVVAKYCKNMEEADKLWKVFCPKDKRTFSSRYPRTKFGNAETPSTNPFIK